MLYDIYSEFYYSHLSERSGMSYETMVNVGSMRRILNRQNTVFFDND